MLKHSVRWNERKKMTIRHTLLLSYLLISVTSALLITAMIFTHFREILSTEIEHKLTSQAATIMQQIDTTLFERMENIVIWHDLAVMQEIRVQDVDKRLSQFLKDSKIGYKGVYQHLFVTDNKHKVISASDSPLIGSFYQPLKSWLNVTLNNHVISFEPANILQNQLTLSLAIPDAFQKGDLGRLYVAVDWQEMQRLLDAALPFSSAQLPSYALLLDAENRVIATSSGLNQESFLFYKLPPHWSLLKKTTGTLKIQAEFLNYKSVLIGYARSQGHRAFKGLGWRVLILQPSESAFAPIWNLWLAILLFLCLTLLLGILVSVWMSAKIARPIVKLADFTHDFMLGKTVTLPQINASDEINLLSSQFSQMIANLEQSRQDVERIAKLAVIGEMAASMAHEVRTPLGILRSSAQMLQRETGLSEIGLEMSEFILSETKRLNDLVTTLLECARPRPPQFTEHNIHEIIEHTLELLQSRLDNHQVTVTLRFDSQSGKLFCDRDQLMQVFLNLIINAIQHIACGGRIDLHSQIDEKQLEVCVCDDGAGISDENKKKVFDPFFTRRQEGIGLGLTVVQQIIFAHHGKIFVSDSPYGGACFHIQLPIYNSEETD
jgi:signal transduction histidine kinase